MLESVIGYATPHLNVQASSTIKAACGTAAFRTRDDPKHDAGHSSAFSFPRRCVRPGRRTGMLERLKIHFVCRAGDRCRWLLRPAVAQAQESRSPGAFRSPAAMRPVQDPAAAVQRSRTFRTSPFPPEFQFGWQSVDKIKSKVVDLNGNTSITYWMGKSQPSDPDWTYTARHMASRRKRMLALIAANTSIPCPGETAVTATGALPDGWDRSRLSRHRMLATTRRSLRAPFDAERGGRATLELPDSVTQWSNKHNACVSENSLRPSHRSRRSATRTAATVAAPCPATIQR